jgi:hypothetical protein
MDWDRLYDLLSQHRLAAFFYTRRSVLGRHWPEAFTQKLRAVRAMLLLYGDQCAAQIKAVLGALRQANIHTIVLKGWAAIPTLYAGDYSARFYEDIDLLVQPSDAARVKAILASLGYQAVDDSWEGYAERFTNAQAFYHKAQPRVFGHLFTIGLHWGLVHRPYYDPKLVDIAGLFSHSEPLEVLGISARQLSTEDQVVYGCAHLGLHHEYDSSLFRLFELAALIQRGGAAFAWPYALNLAEQWRCVIPLQRTLATLHRLWPAIVPAWVMESARNLKPNLNERFVNWWIEKSRDRPTLAMLLPWITIPGLGRKIELAFKDTFPSPAYMQRRYGPAPHGFWPVLYLRRFRRAARFTSQDYD